MCPVHQTLTSEIDIKTRAIRWRSRRPGSPGPTPLCERRMGSREDEPRSSRTAAFVPGGSRTFLCSTLLESDRCLTACLDTNPEPRVTRAVRQATRPGSRGARGSWTAVSRTPSDRRFVTTVEQWLDERSGLHGLSGLGHDMRRLLAHVPSVGGDREGAFTGGARLTFEPHHARHERLGGAPMTRPERVRDRVGARPGRP
jgi:hypothetical protein